MTGLRSAIGFLTILPVSSNMGDAGLSSARMWFPVVGLILGAALAGIDLMLSLGYPLLSDEPPAIPPLLTASILIVALVALTRALHLDGLMDCCDALLGGFDRPRRMEILADPHVGAFAVAGVVCILLVKLSAIMALTTDTRLWVLLVFPCLSRWAVLLTMELFPYVRRDGIGLPFLERSDSLQRVFALAAMVLFALVLAGVAGLVLMSVAGAVAWGVGVWASRLLGGVTGDVYGATIELAEVSVLVSAVLLAHGFSPQVFTSVVGLLL